MMTSSCPHEYAAAVNFAIFKQVPCSSDPIRGSAQAEQGGFRDEIADMLQKPKRGDAARGAFDYSFTWFDCRQLAGEEDELAEGRTDAL